MLNQGLGFVFTAQDMASGVIKGLEGNFSRMARRTGVDSESVTKVFGTLGTGLAMAGAGFAGLNVIDDATQASAKFSKGITEISTMVDETKFSTKELADVAMGLSAAYGTGTETQVKALYQSVSAGASTAAEATEILRVSNELAIGGVTDTETAFNGLSNTMKAYASSGATARDVSDAFFVALSNGKTKAGELAAVIGRVAPTASGVGIKFEELVGSLSAITNFGLKTEEAVTGLKAALANVLKPTSDATAEAARLGIKFDAASLRSKGLKGFLDSITGSAKYNSDSMIKLFGSVEGFNAITALTANNSASLNDILGKMGNKSGATKQAFDKMSGTLDFAQKRFAALKENAWLTIGKVFEPLQAKVYKFANTFLESFMKLPKPVLEFGVKLLAGVSAILIFVGSIIAAKGAIAMLALGAQMMGLSLGGVLAAAAPIVVVIGLIAVAAAGLYVIWRQNIGGIRDFTEEAFGKVALAGRALVQVFSDGGFSGAVMKDLDKAGNEGIEKFVISVYQWVGRIKAFGEGIWSGFQSGLKALEPELELFKNAIVQLGDTFRVLFSQSDSASGSLSKWQAFGDVGHTVGTALSQVFGMLVYGARAVISIFTGMGQMGFMIRDAFGSLGGAFSNLFEQIGKLFGMDASKSMDGWKILGNVIVAVITAIVWAVGFGINFIAGQIAQVRGIIGAFAAVWQGLSEVVTGVVEIIAGVLEGRWDGVWQGMKRVALGVVSAVLQAVLSLASGIGGMIDSIAKSFGLKFSIGDALAGWKKEVGDYLKVGDEQRQPIEGLGYTSKTYPGSMVTAPQSPASPPTAMSTYAPGASSSMPAVAAQAAGAGAQSVAPVIVQPAPPAPVSITTNLTVDGEVLASVVNRANQSSAGRGFGPVPAL